MQKTVIICDNCLLQNYGMRINAVATLTNCEPCGQMAVCHEVPAETLIQRRAQIVQSRPAPAVAPQARSLPLPQPKAQPKVATMEDIVTALNVIITSVDKLGNRIEELENSNEVHQGPPTLVTTAINSATDLGGQGFDFATGLVGSSFRATGILLTTGTGIASTALRGLSDLALCFVQESPKKA